MIVDSEVQVLPAGMSAAVAYVGTEDPLAERPEAAEPFDVDMQQLAGSFALVADRPGRGPAAAAGRRRSGGAPSRPSRRHLPSWPATVSGPAFAYSRAARIRSSSSRRQPARLTLRHRRPISQTGPAALLVAAPQPIAGRTTRTAAGRGLLRTLTSKRQAKPSRQRDSNEKRIPSRRLRSVQHLRASSHLGSRQHSDSPEARTQSAVSL